MPDFFFIRDWYVTHFEMFGYGSGLDVINSSIVRQDKIICRQRVPNLSDVGKI